MIIKSKSYPRAAIIGNPSDGYHGKTIAFIFSNFSAEVILYESPRIQIIPENIDLSVFQNMEDLAGNVKSFGYYGGIRLIKACIKIFYEFCLEHKHTLDAKNFTIEYKTNIPQQLGLAGSSAIITACMRALMKFYQVDIPPALLANLVLSVETDELEISAGLQDRVAQAYEQPVFMDFEKSIIDKQGYGYYQPISSKRFPPFYLAYRPEVAEGSEIVHNDFKARYKLGEKDCHQAIEAWKTLSDKMMKALEEQDHCKIKELINKNFDIRESVMNISSENKEMIEIARSVGASAKFTGSGGAIIGTYEDDIMFDVLKIKMKEKGIKILKPKIVEKSHD